MIFPAGYGCLYYFDRPGWVGREGFGKSASTVPPEDAPGPAYIDSRIRRGGKWAVYFKVTDHTAQPLIQEYLEDTFECAREDATFQIFDLSRTADGSPYRVPFHAPGTRRPESFRLDWSD